MDTISDFLDYIKSEGLVLGRLQGLCHICIGRTIHYNDKIVSTGVTWRELAKLLKLLKFDKYLGTEVNADPEELNPKDRERYWYAVIGLAQPDGIDARTQAQELAQLLLPSHIYVDGFTSMPKAKPIRKSRPKGKNRSPSIDELDNEDRPN